MKRVLFFSTLLVLSVFALITHFIIRKFIYPHRFYFLDEARTLFVRDDLKKRHGAQAVQFTSADGTKLSGLLVKRAKSVGNIVACHGYRGAKETLCRFADMFPSYNILFFDFRGHGESDERYVTIGDHESADVRAAVHFMRERAGGLPLVLLGVSMGAAAASKAVDEEPALCDALVLDSPYAQLEEEIDHAYAIESPIPAFPFLPIAKRVGRYLTGCSLQVRPEEYIERVQVPTMHVHSCNDRFISPSHALRIFEHSRQAKAKVRFWITPPAQHACAHLEHYDLYKKMMGKFFKKFLRTSL